MAHLKKIRTCERAFGAISKCLTRFQIPGRKAPNVIWPTTDQTPEVWSGFDEISGVVFDVSCAAFIAAFDVTSVDVCLSFLADAAVNFFFSLTYNIVLVATFKSEKNVKKQSGPIPASFSVLFSSFQHVTSYI